MADSPRKKHFIHPQASYFTRDFFFYAYGEHVISNLPTPPSSPHFISPAASFPLEPCTTVGELTPPQFTFIHSELNYDSRLAHPQVKPFLSPRCLPEARETCLSVTRGVENRGLPHVLLFFLADSCKKSATECNQP